MIQPSPDGAAAPVRMVHILEVLENPKLSSTARVTYAILRNMVGRDGTVAIYLRDLAARVGCGEATISLVNKELRAAGVISTRGQGTGKPLRYALLGLAIAVLAHSHSGQVYIS